MEKSILSPYEPSAAQWIQSTLAFDGNTILIANTLSQAVHRLQALETSS
jgi:hypothetical protein